MLVTCDTSQSGISTKPAAPQSAPPVEQHFSPEGTAARQLSTAALSAVLSANGVGITHAAVSISSPLMHALLPAMTYPASQVGVQALPLASDAVQSPKPPLAMAPSAPSHAGAGTHVTLLVSTRSVHEYTPPDSTMFVGWHAGTHVEPLISVSVQSPTPPPGSGGVDASHALSLRVHPPPGRVLSVPPVNLAFHASAELNIPSEFVTLDVSQPSGILLNASALSNMCLMVVTELTSHRDISALKDPLL
mmetsp:Transcript_7271/g.32021  ORF Transcript_7271/g.32021 Transcript_7271/m.32021 type:complete len:248 (+) Transcript_7271:222-965(+)